MTTARSLVVREGEDTFYHVVSRCVQRAFLCGYDAYTQRDYGYRRQWVVDRWKAAADTFALVGYWVLGGCRERNVQLCDWPVVSGALGGVGGR